MKRKVSLTPSALVDEIERLKRATAADLKEHWRSLYGAEPPRRISRDLLVRALAYRMQEQALGGLKPFTRRLLAKSPPTPQPTGLSKLLLNPTSNRVRYSCASGTAPSTK